MLTLLVFRLPLGESLRLLADGAFGDKFGVARTLLKSTPLVLTGLGIVVAWRGGMYNVGGEGQYVIGAILGAAAAKAGTAGHWPTFLITLSILIGAVVGGALWAGLSAWLYAKRGVEVVISTILMNFIAIQLLGYSVSGPLQESRHQLPITDLLSSEIMLPRFDRQTDLHAGVFLALFACVAVGFYLFRTKSGFEVRIVGDNPRAARANRINPSAVQVRAMMISGALCGLAGGVEYVGVAGQLGSGFAQNWGFLGIPVALLAGLHPLAIPVSAVYFGALFAGSENLARYTSAGATLIYIIQSVAVLAFVGFRALSEKRAAARRVAE